jgi:hypothetical protein
MPILGCRGRSADPAVAAVPVALTTKASWLVTVSPAAVGQAATACCWPGTAPSWAWTCAGLRNCP